MLIEIKLEVGPNEIVGLIGGNGAGGFRGAAVAARTRRLIYSICNAKVAKLINRHYTLAVKLGRQSALVFLLIAFLFAPLSEVFAFQKCSMLGDSSFGRAESCNDCCTPRQCCSVSARQASDPSALPSSIARVSLSADQLLSDSCKLFSIFFSRPSKEEYSILHEPTSGPPSALLAQLCIRLI